MLEKVFHLSAYRTTVKRELLAGLTTFLTMAGIPLCYSIADGLAFGFISYPVIKYFSGRRKGVSWLMYVMALLLLAYFIFIRARLS